MMARFKNSRKSRLMDSQGRFDLLPGETVSINPVPRDIQSLVRRGFLVELKDRKPAKKDEPGPKLPNADTQKPQQKFGEAKKG